MDIPYYIEESSVKALINLLQCDYEAIQKMESLDTIDNMNEMVTEVFEDFKNSEEYDPELIFLVGKHLNEMGKHLKTIAQDDALVPMRLAEESPRMVFGNKLSLRSKNSYTYEHDKRLDKLESDYKALRKARNSRKKRMRKDGRVTTEESFTISVSKN